MKKVSIIYLFLFFALTMSNAYSECPVSGVEVSVKNLDLNKSFKIKTNKNGKFSFNKLPAGNYALTVSLGGKSMSVGEDGSESISISADDKASGMASGKRKHKPITITKEIDKSSPMLATAIVDHVVQQKPGRTQRVSSEKVDDGKAKVSKRRLDADSDDDGLADADEKRTMKRNKRTMKRNQVDQDCDGRDINDSVKPILKIVIKDKKISGHVTLLKQ